MFNVWGHILGSMAEWELGVARVENHWFKYFKIIIIVSEFQESHLERVDSNHGMCPPRYGPREGKVGAYGSDFIHLFIT